MTELISTKRGWVVKVGHKMELPGVFLTELDAERAAARHEALKNTGNINKRNNKKVGSDASIND